MKKRSVRSGQVSEPHAFQALGMDPYRSDIDDLRHGARRLPPATRRRLLLVTAAALHGTETRRSEKARVGAVKVLVALYPHSREFLRTWLRRFDAHAFEVQFSMFCFLDGIDRDRRQLVEWVHRYLSEVKRDSAHAAWMAGDLLGDHWPLTLTLPALADAARRAHYAAGRIGALHGLEMAAKRLPASDARQNTIRHVLEEVRREDRSQTVRSRAAVIGRALGPG